MTKMTEDAGEAPDAVARTLSANAAGCDALGKKLRGAPPPLAIGRVNADDVTAGAAANVTVEVEGTGELGMRYVLVDPVESAVVVSGAAERTSGGAFTVRLAGDETAGLEAGVYPLSVALFSDEVATLVERTIDIVVR